VSKTQPVFDAEQPVDPKATGAVTSSAPDDADNATTQESADANGVPGVGPVLTDFLDLRALQEIQDGFSAVTHLVTTILDADGDPLTQPTDPQQRAHSDRVLDFLISTEDGDLDASIVATTSESSDPVKPGKAGSPTFVAPIVVEGKTLGSIRIEPMNEPIEPADRERLREVVRKAGVDDEAVEQIVDAAMCACGPKRAAGVQFLYLLANSIARLCFQEHQLRQRVEEMTTLYNLTKALVGRRELQETLDAAARSAAEALKVKAASIRLLDERARELLPKAIYNLSPEYLSKGPLIVRESVIYQQALAGDVVYVEHLPTDNRVIYPDYARREGLVSMVVAPMLYQERRIGVIQLFTAEQRRFSRHEIRLLKAVAQVLAAVIENARLDAEYIESQRVQRQLHMAAKVQKRMLPHDVPHIPPFDIASRYVPSFELGGDFYDFIDLDGNLGIAVGDVVGKGIAASLLMASVRSSLRAYAQDVYDIDEIIARVNVALTRDTLDNEFATLFYGVLDPVSRRFTYCNAGHEPPLLLRNGEFVRMETGGMIVGIDAKQIYRKALLDLQPGDIMAIFTDGVVDAQSESGERFGRERVRAAMIEGARQPGAHELLNHLLWELRRFVGPTESVDDTTLVIVRVDD